MVSVCVCMCEGTGICIFVCVCLGGWVYMRLKLWAPLNYLNVTTETLPLLWHHQNNFLIFFWSKSLRKDLLYNRWVYRCLWLSFRYDSAWLSVCHSAWSNFRSTQTSGHLQALCLNKNSSDHVQCLKTDVLQSWQNPAGHMENTWVACCWALTHIWFGYKEKPDWS